MTRSAQACALLIHMFQSSFTGFSPAVVVKFCAGVLREIHIDHLWSRTRRKITHISSTVVVSPVATLFHFSIRDVAFI
tara:strand:- start:5239 stop:5472 length:234 start_codon:yes stop_codon:yes gene_type:complete